MPSSLKWFHSRTLGFSPRPPVSVCGTDARFQRMGPFLAGVASTNPRHPKTSRQTVGRVRAGGLTPTPYLNPLASSTASSPSIPCQSIALPGRGRNINLLSIDYAFRPRLRIRLTLGGRTFPRKPWAFGGRNFHPAFRYSCLHGRLYEVHLRLRIGFKPHTTLFYHPLARIRGFGSKLSPDHLRRGITRPVRYYAFFK